MSTNKSVTKSKYKIERFMDKYIYPHIQLIWLILGIILVILSFLVTRWCWRTFVYRLNTL